MLTFFQIPTKTLEKPLLQCRRLCLTCSVMKLLRTIFTHNKHHLRNLKCFSPPHLIPFRSLQTSHFSSNSHSASIPQQDSSLGIDSPDEPLTNPNTVPENRRNQPRWSIYGNVFDTSVAPKRINDNSDDEGADSGDEVEDAKKAIPRVKGASSQGTDVFVGNIIGRKKRGAKVKTHWVCSNCGYTAKKWYGMCYSCNIAGTMKEFHEAKAGEDDNKASGFAVLEDAVGLWLPQQAGETRLLKLSEVNRGFDELQWRVPLSGSFGNEVSRVLGGGLVPGSLTLVSGDPGVGKSTLLLQIAALIAEGCNEGEAHPVVYVSGEESLQQIGHRADRLDIKSEIHLYSSTDIEDILKRAQSVSPRALVVDSIQTVYLKGILGSAGGIMQVKECTSALMRFAKMTNIPVLLIGHVTKSGDIAGPRILEHIVDVVLYMEGEKYSSHRMLRAMKNRFGPADELGVFEMSSSGLQAVSDASKIFLSKQRLNSNILAGLAIAVIMDGSRTFLIEIQALCVSGFSVSRQFNGVQSSRANMIICVLIKQAGLQLQESGVFLNVISGLTLTETAGDLAIAAAICSSFLEFPIPNDIAFIGEIGLSGELRMVPRIDKRVNTVAKLGYRICIVPKEAEEVLGSDDLGKLKLVGCSTLKEVIDSVFTK